MKQTSSHFTTHDNTKLFLHEWLPTTEPKAIVQIAHGMAEHSARYQYLATQLVSAGIGVYAHDHRGHGQTANINGELGHFADDNGWQKVIADLHAINQHIKIQHPSTPIFLLGHSMGSFMAQYYMVAHPSTVSGILLCASDGPKGTILDLGMLAARAERWRQGKRGKSLLLHLMSFGQFNRRFKPSRTDFDWLNRDTSAVDEYIRDPLCGFMCTNQFWMDFLGGLKSIEKKGFQQEIPKALPIYVFAGTMDPVGQYAKGIKKLLKIYSHLGLSNVKHVLYPDARHEILHETNKDKVIADLIAWLKNTLNRQ